MKKYSTPFYVIENNLNSIIPYNYYLKYGNLKKYEDDFFAIISNKYYVKADYLDMITQVSFDKVNISFVISNDPSISGRSFQETYVCQTPLYIAYECLLKIFTEKVPKVRNRNASSTFFEPIVSDICARYMILIALIKSTMINEVKSIVLSLNTKSLKISYTTNPLILTNEMISIKKDYFNVFGINIDEIENNYQEYAKKHRITLRESYYNSIATIEILFNIRATTFKKYSVVSDDVGLLTKAEYDIYSFIKNRNGASLRLIADEFGYHSTRAVKYHVDKLINNDLIEKVGLDKSHNCFYRLK